MNRDFIPQVILGALGRWVSARRRPRAGRRPSIALELLESRDLMDGSGALGKMMVQLKAGANVPADQWGLSASSIHATPLTGWFEIIGTDLAPTLQRLKTDSLVAKATISSIISANVLPNDPSFNDGSMWGLNGANGIKMVLAAGNEILHVAERVEHMHHRNRPAWG